uniref:hypothetical protein n=1 Tax=Polaribacter sp. TaxID=1920175 RepID=UPI0040485884
MKKISSILLLMFSTFMFAQNSLNSYKYVVVSDKFDFLKEADKYQTSSLTKFLFNKYGFNAFLNSEVLPDDLNSNRCSALFADVKESSSFMRTKVSVVLKDCNNRIVFTSKEGSSKEKDFKDAYHEALREAFLSVEKLKYTYVPVRSNSNVNPPVVNKKIDKIQVETPIVLPNVNVSEVSNKTKEGTTDAVLYAQVTATGYQLVDTTPKVVFIALQTNQTNVFILKGKEGLLYKNGNNTWIAEYYENGTLTVKKYQIKF